MKLLVIVDMQNDFVTGTLGFPEAKEIIQPIQSKIEEYLSNNDQILFTIDTHFDVTYNKSREGKHLPIYHCINGTKGHELVDSLKTFANYTNVVYKIDAFGICDARIIDRFTTYQKNIQEIEFVGLVTNLCVLSCAICFQSHFTSSEITIDASCCRSFDKDLHEKALDIMEGLQMRVINR